MIRDFIEHLFPRMLLRRNLKITYTFCLGGLAFTSLLVLILSGMLLLFYYQPVTEYAWRSILVLEAQVPGGVYLRAVHKFASNVYLVLLFLHTLRVIWTGAFRPPREWNWVIGMLLLCLSLFTGYTGYLLPMDQLALWATQTGMELLASLPLGESLHALLVPDGVGQPQSLLRFYILHIAILPMAIVALCSLHFYRVRQDKGLLPYL